MDARPADVDSYLAGLPEAQRGPLEDLRQTLKAIAPQAVESMGYGMPALKYRGRPLVYFAAAKNHCGLYGPAIDRHLADLAGYQTSKGTIRFQPDAPLPEALLRKLVADRIADIEAAEAARKSRKKGVSLPRSPGAFA